MLRTFAVSEDTPIRCLQTKIKELAPLRVCEHHLSFAYLSKSATLGGLIARGSWSLLRLKGYWSFAFDPRKTTSAPHQGKKASWRILQPMRSSLHPPPSGPSPEGVLRAPQALLGA